MLEFVSYLALFARASWNSYDHRWPVGPIVRVVECEKEPEPVPGNTYQCELSLSEMKTCSKSSPSDDGIIGHMNKSQVGLFAAITEKDGVVIVKLSEDEGWYWRGQSGYLSSLKELPQTTCKMLHKYKRNGSKSMVSFTRSSKNREGQK